MDKKLAKNIFFSVICSLLLLGTVLGAVFGFMPKKDTTTAFNSDYTETDNAVVVGEIYNDAGYFNGQTTKKLFQMLGNSESTTLASLSSAVGSGAINATTLRGYSNAGNTAGKSIVVTLGGFKWIVTYLSKANTDTDGDGANDLIATLWMADAEVTSTYSDNSSYYGGGGSFTSGYPPCMYGLSYMSAVTLNNGGQYLKLTTNMNNPTSISGSATSSSFHQYAVFTHSSSGIRPYIVQPNKVPYQTSSQGSSYNGQGFVLMNESLATNLTGYNSSNNCQGKTGYTNWGDDYLWLPSLSETGKDSSYPGMWQTSQAERATSNTNSWTRSSSSSDSRSIYTLYSSGNDCNTDFVRSSWAIRPALHLNLTMIAPCATKTITLDQAGGSGGTTSISGWIEDNVPNINIPTRNGYTFAGYYTGVNGTGIQYYNSIGEGTEIMPSKNITLYAMWTINTYTITFNYNGATGGNSTTIKNVTFGNMYETLPTPIKAGSTFGGWYLESNFVTEITAPSTVSALTDHTLYAKWIPTVSVTVSGSSTSASVESEMSGNLRRGYAYITPNAGHYVQKFSFDNVTFYEVVYASAKITNLEFCVSATYEATMSSNDFVLEFSGIFENYLTTNGAIIVYLVTMSTPYEALKEAGGASVSGVAVSATTGGSVTIIGDDYDEMLDTDTITVKADICLVGYKFDGWYLASDMDSCISTEMSEKFKKSEVFESQLVAKFSAIGDNTSINGSTSN